jgi:hypothetical protein
MRIFYFTLLALYFTPVLACPDISGNYQCHRALIGFEKFSVEYLDNVKTFIFTDVFNEKNFYEVDNWTPIYSSADRDHIEDFIKAECTETSVRLIQQDAYIKELKFTLQLTPIDQGVMVEAEIPRDFEEGFRKFKFLCKRKNI